MSNLKKLEKVVNGMNLNEVALTFIVKSSTTRRTLLHTLSQTLTLKLLTNSKTLFHTLET